MKLISVKKLLLNNIDTIFFALAGFIFILMLAHYGGIGVSPDSVTYTSAAKSFVETGKFIEFDEMPYIDFPVGYPVFLSIFFKIFGSDFVHFGAYINAVLFAALVLISGLCMQRFTNLPRLYKIVVLACIVFSPGLLEVYSMLWSETLFILLSVLFIAALYKYVHTVTVSSLITTAVIVALLCIVRYAGIAVIMAGGFVLLLMKHASLKQKILHLLLFGSISVSLLICNLVRNYYVQDYLTGQREKSLTSLHDNLTYFGTVIYDWLPDLFNHHLPELILGILIIVLLAAAVLWHVITKKDKNSFEYIAAVFAFVYTTFIIVIASISRFETLDSRFFSPAFIPMLLVLAYWLNKLVVSGKRWLRVLLICSNIAIAVFFIYTEFNSSFSSYSDIKDYGIPGYTDDDWRLSPTIEYLKAHSGDFRNGYEIYSNGNDAVFFFTNHLAQQLPHKQFPNDVRDFYNDDHFYLVWINLSEDSDYITLKEVLQHKSLKLVSRFQDGAIYVTNDSDE
jgi:hypothetical protein